MKFYFAHFGVFLIYTYILQMFLFYQIILENNFFRKFCNNYIYMRSTQQSNKKQINFIVDLSC